MTRLITQAAVRSSNDLAEERTELAALRTAMAASRSLMAWVRTALSMIGFGFTLYKVLQGFGDTIRPAAARNGGLFLIGLGTVAVLFGWLEYWQVAREMRRHHGQALRRFPLLLAALVALLGILLFLDALTHLI